MKIKPFVTRVVVGCVIQSAVFAGFSWWFHNYMHFSLFWLAWPGLALSKLGLKYTWVVALFLLLAMPLAAAISLRKKSLLWFLPGGAIIPSVYCLIAWWFVFRAPVPLPEKTPYDSDAGLHATYLEKFDEGYRCGIVGCFASYCFSPEVETKAYYQGQAEAARVFNSFLGRDERHMQHLIETSAMRDGVSLTTETNLPVSLKQ
jgi:hypothetical protein